MARVSKWFPVQVLPIPSTSCWGGTAVASNNAWAVGYYYNESTPNRTLILHWNGKRWRIVPSPNASPDWNVLYAVTAAPGGPATAVGYYFDTDNTTKTLVEASR